MKDDNDEEDGALEHQSNEDADANEDLEEDDNKEVNKYLNDE